jgi:hypothetical protein
MATAQSLEEISTKFNTLGIYTSWITHGNGLLICIVIIILTSSGAIDNIDALCRW